MMMSSGMANAIKNSGIQNCTEASDALNKFWNAVKNYIESNLDATYSWVGVNPESGVPDPVVVVKYKVKTSGTLAPCQLNNADSALAAMSAQMNAIAAIWELYPDTTKSPGFSLSPAFIIPSISLSASHLTDSNSALEFVCNQIITGIKMATPTLVGNHAAFSGTATFINII